MSLPSRTLQKWFGSRKNPAGSPPIRPHLLPQDRPGRRGHGFAVGAEKLPALYAARGYTIAATDRPFDNARRKPLAKTGRRAGDFEALNKDGLCESEAFHKRVTHRPVDMSRIPSDLGSFGFTWSTCSLEHSGSIDLDLAEFVDEPPYGEIKYRRLTRWYHASTSLTICKAA